MATLAARSGRFRPGSTVHVTLVGVGTAWEAGDPGSPTFTVEGASVTAQVVASGTAATLVLTVDSDATAVTIADPDNETTATLKAPGAAKRWFPGLRK